MGTYDSAPEQDRAQLDPPRAWKSPGSDLHDGHFASPVVLIAGPTASGKSQLALDLAKATGGVIVNADSMQVYAELSILTARPTAEDLAAAPHRLYGHISAATRYTVGRYLEDVAAELTALNGRPAIVVGGTGLYFSALVNGLADVPDVSIEHQNAARRPMDAGARHRWLTDIDPVMAARLNPADDQRIGRAIEVFLSTGTSLSQFQAATGTPVIGRDALKIVLAPDRAWLRERIAQRFRIMAETGGLDEALAFSALDLDRSLPAMKAIGVPEMMSVATGRIGREEGIQRAITATHQFAKRQETWFRNQLPDWLRLRPDVPDEVTRFLDQFG